MTSRRRVVWLLDNDDPSGVAAMAHRRLAALGPHVEGVAVCLRRAPVRPPAASPLSGILSAGGLSGRLSFALAETVVTTSEGTLRWALRRRRPQVRLVHFVHEDPARLLASERFMEDVSGVDLVLLPPGNLPEPFASALGLPAEAVGVHRDFVLPGESPLAVASAKVFLFVGRFRPGSGAVELARGFALAADRLDGWQVRFVGWGEQRPQITRIAREHRLEGRLLALQPSHDVSGDYLEAGYLVRPSANDTQGLPVLEALAHGVPVLGSAGVPTVGDHVVHGRNGYVLDRTDPGEIAQALVLLGAPEQHAALRAGARSFAPDRHGTDVAELCGWVGARFHAHARHEDGG